MLTVTSGSGAVETFSLPLHNSQGNLQSFLFGSAKGASQPHAAYVDPVTKSFLWVPDLGADLIRVYSIDQETGQLALCPDVPPAKPGSGPRHAAFITGPGGSSRMYVANEKSNSLSVFDVNYGGNFDKRTEDMSTLFGKRYPPRLVKRSAPLFCPTVKHKEEIVFDNVKPDTKANLAEIRAVDNRHLYVSLRGDKFFANFDSIFHLSVGGHGNESTESIESSSRVTASSSQIPFHTGTARDPGSTKSCEETHSTGNTRPTESSTKAPKETHTTQGTNQTVQKRTDIPTSSRNDGPKSTAFVTSTGEQTEQNERSGPTDSHNDESIHNGEIKVHRYPSYGSIPRTFDISPDGRYLAIGNQFSANIAIVHRNPKTGELGGILTVISLPPKGSEQSWNGISSVIWG